jgi:Phosphorylase superfamily
MVSLTSVAHLGLRRLPSMYPHPVSGPAQATEYERSLFATPKAQGSDEPSVFLPEALLREARRQKGLPAVPVPETCVLDPEGDIVRHLRREGLSRRMDAWSCYHSEMQAFTLAGREIGIVGCAVGAPYAVLLAEQMFAAGCKILISITSAGQITPVGPTPYFVVIDRALRDEGTSHHYLPPSEFVEATPELLPRAVEALRSEGCSFTSGQRGRLTPRLGKHKPRLT